MNEARQIGGNAWRGVHERTDFPTLDLERHDPGVVASRGARTADHLVEHDADRVEVGSSVDLIRGVRLFGRHVFGSPHHDARDREIPRLRVHLADLGDPKIDELEERRRTSSRLSWRVLRVRPRRKGHEHILGLEVAMNDAEHVSGLERSQDLARVVAREGDAEPSLALEHGRERLSLEELHDDVGHVVFRGLDVHDLHDVRALDLGGYSSFPDEPVDEARATDEVGMKDLDRDTCPQALVVGLVDGAHPAVAQKAHQAVLATEYVTGLHTAGSLASDAPRCPRLHDPESPSSFPAL
jgi:hypothetical protein